MHISQSAWRDVPWRFSTRNFAGLWPKPSIRIFPALGTQRAKKAMISMVGLFTLMEELAPPMVKPWMAGVLSLVRLMEEYIYIYIYIYIYNMFGLVVTTEAHLAYAGSRKHSNNTAELSSIVARFTPMHFFTIPSTLPVSAWHNSFTGKCPPWSRMSTPFIANSVEATVYHAAHLQSCAESRK